MYCKNSQVEQLKETTNEIGRSISSYQFEQSQFEKYPEANQDILARLFFDQFFFIGFVPYVENPDLIDYFKIYDLVKTDQVNFSSFCFKIIAVYDLKGLTKQAIMFLNHLLESYCNLNYVDRAYILIRFIFYLCEKHRFDQINEAYYTQILDKLIESQPDVKQRLEEAFAVTIFKYEQIVELIKLFLVRLMPSGTSAKLLRKMFSETYQFSNEKYKKMDDFTTNCLLFDNPEVYDQLSNFEKRIWFWKYQKVAKKFFGTVRAQNSMIKSYYSSNNKLFVLKFNYKDNSHKFRYLITKSDRIGVLSKKDVQKISSFKQKGVCSIKRYGRKHSRCCLWTFIWQNFEI